MNKTDSLAYKYMNDNTVFADAFNYFMYKGKQIIDHNSLKELDSKESIYLFNQDKENKTSESVQKYRDIFKKVIIRQDDKAAYVLLGIENQTSIHYAMPVRTMIYDSLSYGKEVSAISKHNRDNKLYKGSDEFLSGFLKNDRLLPVITLVIYFGADPWDGPKSLHEMMCIKDDAVLKYTQDYKIHLIEPNSMAEEDLSSFASDLGKVLTLIKYSKDADRFKKFIENRK